jgi:hypothetical protein
MTTLSSYLMIHSSRNGTYSSQCTYISINSLYRCLLFTAIMTPYRIAFFDLDDITWVVVDSIIDFSFAIDIVLNFFIAYYDSSEDIVDNRK